MEFYVFLPQMRMTLDAIVERSRAAEAAGFTGLTGMDHLAPPMAFQSPMYEAMVTSTWIAARTETLRVGSLVLCDSFRHPAVLAREAVSIDHASGGRFDLGIGWGSVPDELGVFGVGSTEPRVRVGRLKETLEILEALWSGESFDYKGEHFCLRGAQQTPTPLGRIPIVIGGAGPKTMELVAAHADWWNVHVGILDELERMRPRAGKARLSLQTYVSFVDSEERRADIEQTTRRRFGDGPVIGSAAQLVDHFGGLAERGVERVYAWFCDFAVPDTLAAFGEGVIAALR
ncbi:MAG: LLM class flavin-dependent oxidoreductase [Acidobacteriota bacterium]|nr:LLM class flavin-dependent oxidoreductase [Acidobacteriota bacterium]